MQNWFLRILRSDTFGHYLPRRKCPSTPTHFLSQGHSMIASMSKKYGDDFSSWCQYFINMFLGPLLIFTFIPFTPNPWMLHFSRGKAQLLSKVLQICEWVLNGPLGKGERRFPRHHVLCRHPLRWPYLFMGQLFSCSKQNTINYTRLVASWRKSEKMATMKELPRFEVGKLKLSLLSQIAEDEGKQRILKIIVNSC